MRLARQTTAKQFLDVAAYLRSLALNAEKSVVIGATNQPRPDILSVGRSNLFGPIFLINLFQFDFFLVTSFLSLIMRP